MTAVPIRIAIVADIIPLYRLDFYRRILQHTAFDITIYYQTHLAGVSMPVLGKELDCKKVELQAWHMAGQRLWWQRLPVFRLWRDHDLYFFFGNPRILSTVLYATVFRILGRRVVICGQVHTAGANRHTERLRLQWWRMFKAFLVYTDREASKLHSNGFFHKIIVGMNNGLDQSAIERSVGKWPDPILAAWRREQNLDGQFIALSCARLTPKNSFDLFPQVVARIIQNHPNFTWCVIGDGELRDQLAEECRRNGVAQHVRLLGSIYEEDNLAPWFLSSNLLVHPGAIGLTLLHAFGYGLPVVTHDDEDGQMPEIAALRHGHNGLLFRKGDPDSLESAVTSILESSGLREVLASNARATARHDYNTEIMASRFVSLADSLGDTTTSE